MKKILLLLFISITSYAQTQKGSFSFGTGAITYNNEKPSNVERRTTISLNPRVGYLLSDNFEAGLGVLYEYTRYREVTYVYISHDVALTPYLIYHFGQQRFQPFVGLSGGLVKGRVKYVGETRSTFQGFVGDVTAGGNYFFTRSIALGLNAGYRYTRQKVNTQFYGDFNSLKTKLYIGVNFTFYLSSHRE